MAGLARKGSNGARQDAGLTGTKGKGMVLMGVMGLLNTSAAVFSDRTRRALALGRT